MGDWPCSPSQASLSARASFRALTGESAQTTSTQPTIASTVAAEKTTFEKSIRIGGTVGATNFAMIRAPRMRGGRDRGGGSSLTIQTLAEAGTVVEAGDVVAEFESKQTQDVLDNYASMLAQTKAQSAARKAEMLIATETLRQNYRTTKAEAEKAAYDYQTAEVRSAIQAEIFRLLAEEGVCFKRRSWSRRCACKRKLTRPNGAVSTSRLSRI